MKPARIRASKIMVTNYDKLTNKQMATKPNGEVWSMTIIDLPLFGSHHPKKKVKNEKI